MQLVDALRVEIFFDRDPNSFGPAHVHRVKAMDLKHHAVVFEEDVKNIQTELDMVISKIKHSGD